MTGYCEQCDEQGSHDCEAKYSKASHQPVSVLAVDSQRERDDRFSAAVNAIPELSDQPVDCTKLQHDLAFVLAEVEPLPETDDSTTNIFQSNIWELQAEAAIEFLRPYLHAPGCGVPKTIAKVLGLNYAKD